MFSFHECILCPTSSTVVEHFSLVVIIIMAPKRVASKGSTKSSTGEAVEQALVNLPVYVYTQLFI